MAIFHDEFNHGRVVHGHAARHMLEKAKRDSHGSLPKMNLPRENDNKWKFIHDPAGKDVVETVYSQVYVTESNTLNGPVEWVTETGTAPGAAAPTPTLNEAQQSYASAKSLANNPPAPTVGAPLQNSVPASTTTTDTATQAVGTPLQNSPVNIAGNHGTETGAVKGTPLENNGEATPVKGTPLAATGNESEPGLINEKSDGGMSGGEKAGLAFGIIILLALVGGLIFFCLRRRKQKTNKEGMEQLNEKHASANSFFGGTAAAFGATAGDARGSVQSRSSTRTASTAPRLSLRPVTQFLPNIMESRKSTGNALNVPQMSEKPKSGWERPAQNPFSDAAVLSEKQARPESPPSNPFDEGDGAVVAAAKATPSHSQNNSWDGAEPATPKSTTFGTAAAVPVANGAGPRGPNNVHRVQLDFKQSMDDELSLKSGQLVRMLHEYDDGWVSLISLLLKYIILTFDRLSVSAWTALNKVSALVPASLSCPSSHAHKVLHQMVQTVAQ